MVGFGPGQAESLFRVREGQFPTSLEIGKTADDRAHESPLVFRRLVIGDGLHHGQTAPAPGEPYGPMDPGSVRHDL